MPRSQRPKENKSSRVLGLIALVLAELIIGIYLLRTASDKVGQAFIVKNGRSYILLWKSPENETVSRHYSYLHQALQFASDELGLEIGPNPSWGSEVSAVWSRDDLGRRMVFWTTREISQPQRLTFSRIYEAEVFRTAFSRGAYTPSPFGHSLSLVPKLSKH